MPQFFNPTVQFVRFTDLLRTPCGRQRRNQVLPNQQNSEETVNRPSRYRSDLCSKAPPSYDDVINNPEDYPIYQAQGKRTFIALHLLLSFRYENKKLNHLPYCIYF